MPLTLIGSVGGGGNGGSAGANLSVPFGTVDVASVVVRVDRQFPSTSDTQVSWRPRRGQSSTDATNSATLTLIGSPVQSGSMFWSLWAGVGASFDNDSGFSGGWHLNNVSSDGFAFRGWAFSGAKQTLGDLFRDWDAVALTSTAASVTLQGGRPSDYLATLAGRHANGVFPNSHTGTGHTLIDNHNQSSTSPTSVSRGTVASPAGDRTVGVTYSASALISFGAFLVRSNVEGGRSQSVLVS